MVLQIAQIVHAYVLQELIVKFLQIQAREEGPQHFTCF